MILERTLATKAWEEEGNIYISGELVDDRHHIRVILGFDSVGEKVKEVREVSWIRAPYPYCSDVAPLADRILGLGVKTGATAIINDTLGASEGCIHLAEVVVQVFKCFYQARHRLEDAALKSEEERKARKYRVLRNSCYAYTDRFFLANT